MHLIVYLNYNVMKTVLSKWFLPFSLTLLLISCNTGELKFSENNIQFDSISVEKTYYFFDIETNPNYSLQINFIYPVDYSSKQILNLIQQQFVSGFFGDKYGDFSPNEAVEKYIDDFIIEYKEEEDNYKIELDEFNAEEHEHDHDHDAEFNELWYSKNETFINKIIYNRNDLLSFVVYKEGYYGGAQASHNYINRVIDLKTGQRITEDDIFVLDYQDDLTEFIIDAIAFSNNVEIDELENIGFFDVNEIYPNKNFYVDETGIFYTYNEYEISAYVVGEVTIQIPYEKIRHLLRPESPLSEIAFR